MPVFVVEYKAAHKLRGSTLKLAFSDTTREPQGLFAAAIREQQSNKIIQGDGHAVDRAKAEKATARVIAQAFHCMVEFGLCYSYVASAEGFILLYLDPADNGYHRLTPMQFCNKLREQLADDLDENCDALDKFGKFGAIGMLFRLTLRSHGYCVVAKGVQRVHAPLLEQEVAIYGHLREQQGTLVPVCLGVIDLVDVYRTSFGAHVSHMMVMSYAGEPIHSTAGPLPDNISSLVYNAWIQLRQLGVDHGDERHPNILWNAPLQRLMYIDFERATITSRKRKYGVETQPAPKPVTVPTKQAREARRLVFQEHNNGDASSSSFD
ncbi:hypothetical protein SCUCBS95973_004711 [Sporothrix curviconia]|uniref:Protein kinase domain-containing protein n=1 Tax=Sporothrix curviconia TaxID=1260050 RepID=A0ABP0BRA9_9PEZI